MVRVAILLLLVLLLLLLLFLLLLVFCYCCDFSLLGIVVCFSFWGFRLLYTGSVDNVVVEA